MKLNKWQQAVVDDLASGPQVVEACPGSGKTMTTEELVPALLTSGVDPLKLLVVTFSNKAASESRRRIAAALFPGSTPEELAFFEGPKSTKTKDALKKTKGWVSDSDVDAWVRENPMREMIVDYFSTIHALSNRTLGWLGYNFKIIAKGHQDNGKRNLYWDAEALVKDGLKELDWDESHRAVQWWFGAAINSFVEPHEAEQWFADRLAAKGGPVWDAPKLAELYKRYRSFCKRHQALDFNLMQANLLELLRKSSRVREKVASRFDVIIVDEAQDTSTVQCEILWHMAARTGRIVFVGDVDQAMYSWRGAEPEVLRGHFEKHWGKVRRFNLPVNYRSTHEIVRVTAELIGDNYENLKEYLKPFEPRPDAPDGVPVTYLETGTFDEMVDELATQVLDNPGEWFILSRTRAECAAIHTKLVEAGVPAVNKSGGLLFGATHVRKVLGYARLACNYKDARDDTEILSEVANVATTEFVAPMNRRRHLETCQNTKPWVNCGCPLVYEKGVDLSATRFYGRKSIERAGSWRGVIDQQYDKNKGGFPTTSSYGARDLVAFVGRLEQLADDARACLQAIIEGSVLNWLKHTQGINDEDLAENGKAEDFDFLVEFCHPDEDLESYLDRIETLTRGNAEGDESTSALVGTIHWSKGAERPKVAVNTTRLPIIPPSPRAGQLPTTNPPTPAEERRLLFVAMTRAQNEIHLLGSQEWNGQDMERSWFVSDLIDKGLVTEEGVEAPSPEVEKLSDKSARDLEPTLTEVIDDIKEKSDGDRLLSQFPDGGRFEDSIYRPAAKELVCAMDRWTPTVENGQLVMEKDLGHGSTAVCYTSVKVGQIAGGTGSDSIRVIRRDVTDRGTFWFKGNYAWVTRTVPAECDTPEKAISHLVAKIEERVGDFMRRCPECDAPLFKCRAGKGRETRTWWKATCGHNKDRF